MILAELFGVAQHVRQLAVHHAQLTHIAFAFALAQIGIQRVIDFLLVLCQGSPQAAQSVKPAGDRQRVARGEVLLLLRDLLLQCF